MKVFSIEEVEELVPFLKECFERIFNLNRMLKTTENDITVLLDLWGEEIHQKNHIDNEYYAKLLRRQEEFMKHLQQELKGVQRLGCFVKDIERGLVDFYHELDGELVFLCWKYGEEKIRYWHSVRSGFSGRRPITDLFAMHR